MRIWYLAKCKFCSNCDEVTYTITHGIVASNNKIFLEQKASTHKVKSYLFIEEGHC